MSYEWFANTFPMRAFWGFNKGSTYERVNGYAATAVNTPSMRPGVGLYTGPTGVGCLYYGNVLDITDTTAPFTMVADVDVADRTLLQHNVLLQKRYSFAPGWYFSLRFGNTPYLTMSNPAGTLTASLPGMRQGVRGTVVVSYDGSLAIAGVRGYENGVPVAVGGASALPAGSLASANPVYVGFSLLAPGAGINIRTVAWIDRAVTGSEAARIYEHLRTERPARIHPRRKFSIPMPLRTQTQELADGYIYAASGGMLNGKWPDQIQGVRNAARVGPIDVAKSGPFCEHVANHGPIAASLTLPAGDTDVFNTNDWTFSCWLMVPAASATVRKIVQLDGTNYYIALDAAEKIVVSSVNGAAAQVTTTSTAALVTGKWYHVLVSRQMTGLDARTRILLDGTVDTDSTSVGIGVTLPGAGNPSLAAGVMHLDAVRYRKNVVTSDADARTECLVGGKKVLFDGRLCRTGCCPVTPVAISGAMNAAPGAPWVIASGAYRILEDAPSALRAGKRRLQFTVIGTVYSSDLDAFGSWYFEMNKAVAGSTLSMAFVSDKPDATSASVGYRIDITSSEAVNLYRNTGAAALSRFTSAVGYVANGVLYAFWVSRTASEFTVWIKGGAFAVWTLVSTVGGAGTNPVAEAVNNTSRYAALRTGGAGSSDEFGDVIHYQIAMTPTEAIALGILEP